MRWGEVGRNTLWEAKQPLSVVVAENVAKTRFGALQSGHTDAIILPERRRSIGASRVEGGT